MTVCEHSVSGTERTEQAEYLRAWHRASWKWGTTTRDNRDHFYQCNNVRCWRCWATARRVGARDSTLRDLKPVETNPVAELHAKLTYG